MMEEQAVEQKIAPVKKKSIVDRKTTANLASPENAKAFADQLKDLIVRNKLFTPVKGKNYVNVEGWQIAGAFCGLEPIVEKVENLSDEKAIRYRAEVSLVEIKTNRVCGRGMAICTNKEAGKHNFEEYAVASMAQTRAVGKAYRLKLGWLMKLAGYEATPSEEIDSVNTGPAGAQRMQAKPEAPRFSEEEIDAAKAKLESAKTVQELQQTWFTIGKVRNEPAVVEAKDKMKAILSGQEAQEGETL